MKKRLPPIQTYIPQTDEGFPIKHFLFILSAAILLRILPLFWSTESLDIALYRYQAISVLDHINPYLFYLPRSLTNIQQPYVYLPFSIFYAPLCLQMSYFLQVPFHIVIKLSPILFDLAIITTLYFFFHSKNENKARQAAWIYALSPIAILISSFHGNIMSGPVFLCLLSFLLFYKEESPTKTMGRINLQLSALFLGMAIAWRTYPLLLLPAFLLKSKDLRSAVRFALFAGIPVLATSIPFLISSPAALFHSLSYTGVSGTIGWHIILDQVNTLFIRNPSLALPKDLSSFFHSNTYRIPVTLFVAAYFALFAFGRKRLDLLKLLILPLLLLYGVSTTVAQQYFLWVLPFLILWSLEAAWIYSIIGGVTLAIRYWALYPEILFGSLPVIKLTAQQELLTSFAAVTCFWILTVSFIVILLISKRQTFFSSALETAEPSDTRKTGAFHLSPIKIGKFIERLVYFGLIILTIAESVFILRLDRHNSWKAIKTIKVNAPQTQRIMDTAQERTLPIPKACLYEEGFLWFDPQTKKMKVLSQDGTVENEYILTHPKTGAALDVFDIKAVPGKMAVVTDWQKGFLGKFDPKNGQFITDFSPTDIVAPTRMAVGPDGMLAVIDVGKSSILLLSDSGKIVKEYYYHFGEGRVPLESFDIGIDDQKNIYLLDGVSQKVHVVSYEKSAREKLLRVRIFMPSVKLAVGHNNFFCVLNLNTSQISIYSPKGKHIAKLENTPGVENEILNTPCDLLIDSNDRFYVVDAWKSEIIQVLFDKERN